MLQWYYLALISGALTGLAYILEKKTLKKEYASAYSASFSILIAIVSLIFLPFLKLDITLKNWILIYIASLLLTITYLLTARIFKHGSMSAVSPLNSTLPILFIVVLAVLFLHETLTIVQYAGIGLTIFATYMILYEGKGSKEFGGDKYKHIILINAIFTGFYTVIFKYVLITTTPVTFLVLSQIFVAINMAVYMTFKYGGFKEIISNTKIYSKELIVIVILTIGYRLTYYSAVAMAAVSLATPLRNTLLVIMTVFSGLIVFKEGNIRNKIMLSILMLVGAILIIV
jgi:drug/metabolite transporter (DMT)-like permease